MASAEQAQGNHETLELPGRMHPVLGVLAFLPIMIIILGILALILETPPPLFMAIFASVLVCCAIISWQALAIMLGGSVEFMPEGLKVKRLFQEQVYPWRTLEKCSVMPGTGTLGDNALAGPEDRVGVGLFVRGGDRQREHDLDADVVLCTGDSTNVQAMMRIAQHVQKAIERADANARRQARRPSMPSQQAGRPVRAVRRNDASKGRWADKPEQAADVVSSFRRKAQ